jgi:hypothetical protein
MGTTEYIYELRVQGDKLTSTGRILLEEPVTVGDVVFIAGTPAEIVAIIVLPAERRLLLRQ